MTLARERLTNLCSSVEIKIVNTFVTNPQWEFTSIGKVLCTEFILEHDQAPRGHGPIRQWIREENHISNVDMIGIKKSGE